MRGAAAMLRLGLKLKVENPGSCLPIGTFRYMTLALRIRQGDGSPTGQAAERLLENGRLVLGRGGESDWVLTDPERTISKRHCVIEKADLGYEITDLSTNGVFLNDDDEPVGVGNTRKLRHGDRIRIGPYSLLIELSGEGATSPEPTSLGLAGSFDSVTELFRDGSAVAGPGAGSGESLTESPFSKPRELRNLDQGAPIDAFFAPQQPAPAAAARQAPGSPPADPALSLFGTPDEWVKAAAAMAAPVAAPPTPVSPASTSHPKASEIASDSELIGAFCAGARLDPAILAGATPEQTMRQAGELLRIAVEGLMAVLEVRRTLKSEFRLVATEFRPAENNPLKFSVDAESAMQMLVGRPQRGFLPAKQAFDEAVDDLRMHEMAILAGMQEAWLNLLERFNPRDLSGRLEDDSGLAHLLSSKKARCWDAFVTLYDSIAGNADNEWERTFQNIFGAAYERSMQQQRQHSG